MLRFRIFCIKAMIHSLRHVSRHFKSSATPSCTSAAASCVSVGIIQYLQLAKVSLIPWWFVIWRSPQKAHSIAFSEQVLLVLLCAIAFLKARKECDLLSNSA